MARGLKPKGQVLLKWSPRFAYAIGLLVADGCVSKDGRHIDFTSKDRAQVQVFKKCLGLSTKLGHKYSSAGNLAYRTQFGDVLFCRFLKKIGITQAKSKTIGAVAVPDRYFLDFIRGYFDGDGSSTSYYDPAFPKSFRFYLSFTSASLPFLEWLKGGLHRLIGVGGYIARNRNNPYGQLKYAKRDAVTLCNAMYYARPLPCLRRKRLKIQKSMRIIEGRRDGVIGKHAVFRTQ